MKKSKPRRGNGDGSIFKLSGKRRKPYAVRVTVGWSEDGKQKYKYIGYYESIKDAKTALREHLLNPEKIKAEKQTLKSIFEKMIEKSDFSEGTKQQYIGGFKQLHALHDKSIADIELEEIEEILENHVPNGQKRIKKTLSNCYKYAMRYDYVNKNLADFITVKTEKAAERVPFTVAEVANLWKFVGTERFDDLPLILLYTGLRISELLELRTENIDLENKTISVMKSKTAAGIRVVPIHKKIMPFVQKRHNPKNTHFITLNGKGLSYSQYLSSYWKIKNHTIHETRHSFITYLQKCNNDNIAIKKLAGHAVSDITEHYTHRTLEELSAVLNSLEYK